MTGSTEAYADLEIRILERDDYHPLRSAGHRSGSCQE